MGAQMSSSSRIGQAGGRSRAYRPMADINVTPFVDVMMVLLVVFMVAAPLLTAGVDINLPRADAPPITAEDNKPLEVSMNASGDIFVGETAVERSRLITLLTAMTKDEPERRIYVRADETLSYGAVMEILGALNQGGFRKVALLSEPRP